MSRTINLVASNEQTEMKRVLPRFPICYLTFKENSFSQALEVVNISSTGMQLLLKHGEMPFTKGQSIKGELHWHGKVLVLSGDIVWATSTRVGVEFHNDAIQANINDFFAWKNIGSNLKPVHNMDYPFDLPAKLKYWLRADGPHELFVWQYSTGELESFSIIVREQLVIWEQGHGIRTGRVISKRGVELPLSTEDEFIFLVDSLCQKKLVEEAIEFASILEEKHLPEMMRDFLRRKLSI